MDQARSVPLAITKWKLRKKSFSYRTAQSSMLHNFTQSRIICIN